MSVLPPSATLREYAPPPGFVRLRLTVAWDGRSYAGWQSQPNIPNVQDTLQVALAQLGIPSTFRPVAAGRTDAGVHAEAMPIHWDIPEPLRVPPERLARALNAHLPPSVSVLVAKAAPANFHARFSCTERQYVYRLWVAPQRHPLWEGRALHLPGKLNAAAMQEAAQLLIGTHDFAAFATQEDRQTVRELRALQLGQHFYLWEIQVAGESFLRHMVRGLVGTLLLVGQEKLTVNAVSDILASRQRARAGANVAPYGLYFAGANYPESLTSEQHWGVRVS